MSDHYWYFWCKPLPEVKIPSTNMKNKLYNSIIPNHIKIVLKVLQKALLCIEKHST